jgi:hypothetical protein
MMTGMLSRQTRSSTSLLKQSLLRIGGIEMPLNESAATNGFDSILNQIQSGIIPESGEIVTDSVTAVQRRLVWEDAGASRVIIQSTFDALWLPEAEVYRHLTDCGFAHGQIDERLELLAGRRENLFDLLSKQPVTYIYPQTLQDAVLLNGRCRISGRQLLANRDLTLEASTLWRTLAMMLAAAGRFESLRFQWPENMPYDFDITVYKTVGICVARTQNDLFIEAKQSGDWLMSDENCYNDSDPQGLDFLNEAAELLAAEGVG